MTAASGLFRAELFRAGHLRARLRAATAEAHAALETRLDLERRLSDAAAVRTVLARFHGFFAGLEPALAAALEVDGARILPSPTRLGELAHDLRALGLPAAAIARLPVCAEAGRLAGASEAWGALYVVEGARVGGVVIARRLAAARIVHGLRFWSEDTSRTAGLWSGLIEALERVEDADAAERGAVATFARLDAWFAAGG